MAARYADDLRSDVPRSAASWVRPEKLHLTLRFIGNCTAAELLLLTEVVDSIAVKTQPFDLAIKGTGVFPTTRQARVAWLGVHDPTDALGSIHIGIMPAGGLAAAASSGRSQQFSPHLTIARIKDIQKCRALISQHLGSSFESPEFRVSEVVIYESSLHPDGSVYKVLSSHPFRAQSI